eukprot:CAMPEP_0180712056 /NCGR_PEP_ID=MMETSP1038_2-20121128/11176_1 /TAXON_ID=632150 /ORGANISM="Azadinium spinosum, Strain 3D9" /LENGTH=248 /DNA_ID=CAMNT_0022744311 /DNA_START=83 /DNA_END=827 /DNA_ORIENTATION=-
MKLLRKVSSSLDSQLLKYMALAFIAVICAIACLYGAWDNVTMRTRLCVGVFNLMFAPLCMKLGHLLATVGAERMLEVEQESLSKDIVNFVPPSLAILDTAIAPLRQLLCDEVVGLERVPTDYPCFYVMNHSLMGVEMPSFVHVLYKEKGIFVPLVVAAGPIMRAFGAVDGTRPNVDLLMKHGQNVLVYPGGGSEIMKSKADKRYSLMWKERLGFARMAIKNQYHILPCACVGTEDMLDILMDVPMGPL